MKNSKKVLVFLAVLALFNFVLTEVAFAITRNEIMNIAQAYKDHQWVPTTDNICHKITKKNGRCVQWNEKKKCIKWIEYRIDTPDRNTYKTWPVLKGWKAEKENEGQINESWKKTIGLPYNWGGASSISEVSLKEIKGFKDFDNEIASKECAGNIYYDGRGESGAAGVDCSGFVTRSWNLSTKYSTSMLPKISKKLVKKENNKTKLAFEKLKKGDIVNRIGHVRLFKEFIEAQPPYYKLQVYESSASDWKVNKWSYKIKQDLENKGYKPYAYSNIKDDSIGVDVELVIDKSGSMYGQKIADAKSASKQFVDLMKTKDKVGVVSFANSASADYQLTEITGDSIKTSAKQMINNISAGGGTSIGAGMQTAQNQLNSFGKDDLTRAIILLSDGNQNKSPYADEILPGIIDDEIKVCTIGLGSGANENLLSDIASQTGCFYSFAPNSKDLQGIYRMIQAEISGEDIIKTGKGKITQGEEIIKSVFVDASVSNATFSVSWQGSDVDLSLIQPDGKIINPSIVNEDIEFIEGSVYEFYRIDAPVQGEWTVKIFGKEIPQGGEDFTFILSGQNAMSFEAEVDKSEYYQGDEIRISVFIEDQVVDFSEAQYILGVDVEVEVMDPNQNISNFNLYDSGINGDEEAGDGIYANIFSNTSLIGNYVFKIKATGNTNRFGDPFTREKTFSVIIKEVVPEATNIIYLGDVSGQYSDAALLKAFLSDKNGNAIPNKIIDFVLGNQNAPAITNENGIAEANLILSQKPGGYSMSSLGFIIPPEPPPQSEYSVQAIFTSNDASWASSLSEPKQFEILKEKVIINIPDKDGLFGETINFSAEISDDDGQLLLNNSYGINFSLSEQFLGESVISATGQAELEWNIDIIPKNKSEAYPIFALFSGNEYYEAAQGDGEFILKSSENLKESAKKQLEEISPKNWFARQVIKSAIRHIDNSLKENLWIDASHPDLKKGIRVFNNEIKAVIKLKLFLARERSADGLIVKDAIDKLVKADEIIAKVAIEEAEGHFSECPFISQRMNKAKEEFSKGRNSAENNLPAKAISHFEKAWVFVKDIK